MWYLRAVVRRARRAAERVEAELGVVAVALEDVELAEVPPGAEVLRVEREGLVVVRVPPKPISHIFPIRHAWSETDLRKDSNAISEKCFLMRRKKSA